MYSYNYSYTSDLIKSWGILFLLSFIGGILAYFLFVKKDLKLSSPFLTKLKAYFNFETLLIEDLFKLTYVIMAIFTTLFSFTLISTNFFLFIVYLILGNIIIRIIYEKLMLVLMIWKNTSEISKNTAKEEIKVEEVKAEEIKVEEPKKEEVKKEKAKKETKAKLSTKENTKTSAKTSTKTSAKTSTKKTSAKPKAKTSTKAKPKKKSTK